MARGDGDRRRRCSGLDPDCSRNRRSSIVSSGVLGESLHCERSATRDMRRVGQKMAYCLQKGRVIELIGKRGGRIYIEGHQHGSGRIFVLES